MPNIRTREREGIVLIDVSDSVSDDAGLLHAEIAKPLARGLSGIVLNLEHVTYVNSTWLGAIVTTFAKLRTAGGQLKLLNVPPNLMKTLAVTKLSTVFDIFTSEDDAVNSYSTFIILRRLETCDVPDRLRRWQWVDLFAADGYDRLITALQHARSHSAEPLQIA